MTGPRIDPLADYSPDWRKSSGDDDPLSDYSADWRKPGTFVERGLKNAAEGIANIFEHPIETAKTMVATPIKAAFTAAFAPSVGEARHDPRLSKGGNSSGRAIDTTPYDAEHGGVTQKERTAAGLQTIANIAAPAAFNPIKNKLGTTAALALTGAAPGAAANPDDPAAGAVAGGVSTAILGNTARGAAKAIDKVREPLSLANRIRKATPLDEAAVADNKATRAVDELTYGRAAEEAAANGGTSPALAEALEHPRIKPFVEMVRASDKGHGADDATLAREAYKLMSRQRRGLQRKLAVDYDAKADLDAEDLANAMRRLKTATATRTETDARAIETAQSPAPTTRDAVKDFWARPGIAAKRREGTVAQQIARQALERHDAESSAAPPIRGEPPKAEIPAAMPSFPTAVAEHARMKGNRAAFETAAERTNKIMRGTRVPAKKLGTESPAAWMEQILGMSPEEADAALRGTLGEAKGQAGYRLPRDASIVGAIKELGGPAQRLNRIAPFVRALDQQAGSTPFQPMNLQQYLRYLATLNGPIANP